MRIDRQQRARKRARPVILDWFSAPPDIGEMDQATGEFFVFAARRRLLSSGK